MSKYGGDVRQAKIADRLSTIDERRDMSERGRGGQEGVGSDISTVLICHDGALLDKVGLSRWLASFSNLAGIVVIRETKKRAWQRIKRELKRVGPLRFLDVFAFRLYYKLFLAAADTEWERSTLEALCKQYNSTEAPILLTSSPNSAEAEAFIRKCKPDFVVARCKSLLKESVFLIPSNGTFVMHPGICPEYRNAHGCFWALANDDLKNVGMTLLKIDRGVDTGPIYGYYRYPFDEVSESHMVIQQRVVTENLASLAERFREIKLGSAQILDVAGRPSGTWGQPWLTKYLRWKRKARQRKR